jgi:hypothetical protein
MEVGMAGSASGRWQGRIVKPLDVALAALLATGCHHGGGSEAPKPEAGPAAAAAPAPSAGATTGTDATPGAAPVCALGELSGGKGPTHPYASLPFQSARVPADLYGAVRTALHDEGFDLCGERPEQGVLATGARKLKAPGSDTNRRVAVALYLTASRGGSQGQLWVVATDQPRDAAERQAMTHDLRAIAQMLKGRVVGQ